MIVPTTRRIRASNPLHWRWLPVGTLARQGFVTDAREWWHFSLPGAGSAAFDFPVTSR
ncbi:hypothetical protein [Bradyrhizobium sp. WD16]|uniref:hypothetical protein n=1 Tax=Bradyrhizobium sp. WD16 TaxID=1521768 RepID=UPI0035318A8D